MRMWKVNTKVMCRKHLLGEHVEMHMFIGCLNKGMSVTGYINKGLIELNHIYDRHRELVDEMVNRGYNHNSPLPNITINNTINGFVNSEENLIELSRRCLECRKLQEQNTHNI